MVSVALFYRGLAIGRMGMVAPITAVVSAIVPVAWGLTFGERPSALALDRRRSRSRVGRVDLVRGGRLAARAGHPEPHAALPRTRRAGLGFGAFFVLYSNAGDRAGHVAAARVAVDVGEPSSRSSSPSSLALGVTHRRGALLPLIAGAGLVRRRGERLLPGRGSRTGLLSIVGAVSSLYPASTVLLARGVLHERFHRTADHRARPSRPWA